MPVNPAGQRPAHSTTEPAASREAGSRAGGVPPAVLRQRTSELRARSAEPGRPMRRADAYCRVLTYADEVADRLAADAADGTTGYRVGSTRPEMPSAPTSRPVVPLRADSTHGDRHPGERVPLSVINDNTTILPPRIDAALYDMLPEIYLAADRAWWLKRAEELERARPRPQDWQGNATRAEPSAQWQRLTATAQACRARAQLCPVGDVRADIDIANVFRAVRVRGRTITDRGTTFVFRGFRARDLAHEAGVTVLFNGVAGGHVGDSTRLPQLLASLDSRRVAKTFVSLIGDKCPPPEREHHEVEQPEAGHSDLEQITMSGLDYQEPTLFGGAE